MTAGARRGAIPRGVWVLGLVSLCMDLSSELVHALLPLYMATVMGASMLVIGVVEGIAEATALVVKLFSGVISDAFRRRKPLVLLGYGLGALSKLVFPLAPTLGWIVAARFADRVGKGVRGAPRDALIADLAPPAVRGRSSTPSAASAAPCSRWRRWRTSRTTSPRRSGSRSCRPRCASR